MDRIINRSDEGELYILRAYLKSLANNVPNLKHDFVQQELIDISLRIDVIIKNIERRNR